MTSLGSKVRAFVQSEIIEKLADQRCGMTVTPLKLLDALEHPSPQRPQNLSRRVLAAALTAKQ